MAAMDRNVLFVEDNFRLRKEDFLIPKHYLDTIDYVMLPKGLIMDRVEKLASDIVNDYPNQSVHLVCTLKGGSDFFHDLITHMRRIHTHDRSTPTLPFTIDFIRAKSYEGTESTGTVEVIGGDMDALKGKNVILVEDIVDTGRTMSKLLPHLQQYSPTSLKVATLLEKRTSRSNGYLADYAAFSIPDRFVIGYCMDYNEMYRDLSHICVINDTGIAKYAEEA